MKNFEKIASGLDMGPLQAELAANPQLWDQFDGRRTAPGSPHAQMTDIWVRYGADPIAPGPHESVWYPAARLLPSVVRIAYDLMAETGGEALGGILLTRLPAGGIIERHVDGGWHAQTYQKLYVAINAPVGANFWWDDGVIKPTQGDVWWFRNDVPHSVINDSREDRLAAIICVRTSRFKDNYEPL